RYIALLSVLDVTPHAGAAALVEQRPRKAAHQQLGHQILEHGAAPRHQRRAAVDVGHKASKVKPVMLRHVALRNGDETGQPRLRCQQIVKRAVESSWSVCISQPVSDRKNAAPSVVEEVE